MRFLIPFHLNSPFSLLDEKHHTALTILSALVYEAPPDPPLDQYILYKRYHKDQKFSCVLYTFFQKTTPGVYNNLVTFKKIYSFVNV